MRILIAEDETELRRAVAATLAAWAYEVETVDDGHAAVDRLVADDAPPVALIDRELRGLDGPSLCRHLRADPRGRTRYLILLTGRGAPADIAEALEAGADDYVLRPFEPVELRARIRAGTRLLELQRALHAQQHLQGALETAGAVCHELNQPVQVVTGWSELLLADLPPDDPRQVALEKVAAAAGRVGRLTKRLIGVTRHATEQYVAGAPRIIDRAGCDARGAASGEDALEIMNADLARVSSRDLRRWGAR